MRLMFLAELDGTVRDGGSHIPLIDLDHQSRDLFNSSLYDLGCETTVDLLGNSFCTK